MPAGRAAPAPPCPQGLRLLPSAYPTVAPDQATPALPHAPGPRRAGLSLPAG